MSLDEDKTARPAIDTIESTSAEPSDRTGPARWWLVALVLVPLVAAAFGLLALTGEFRPVGDIAQQELNVRDLGRDPVLVGPYSRDGWSHLGPMMYYIFVGPYRLLGDSSLALLVGALTVNGLAILGIVLIARRRGGDVLFVAAVLGCAVVVRALGGEWARNPWNPFVTVLPYGFLVFLAWAMACGSTKALPVAVVVTTFLVQTHVGYVALAAPLLLWGLCALIVEATRRFRAEPLDDDADDLLGSPRSLLLNGTAGLALAAALWVAPIVDEISNDPGNMTAVYRYLRNPPDELHSLADGVRVMFAQFSLWPSWLSGDRGLGLFQLTAMRDLVFPVTLPVPVVASVVLWRKGPPAARRYLVTLAVAWASGIVSIARTPGVVYAYRLFWVWLLAMLSWLVVVWAITVSLTPSLRASIRKPVCTVAVAGIVTLTAVNSVGALSADIPDRLHSDRVDALLPQVKRDLADGRRDVLFRDYGWGSWWMAYGLMLGLDRSGSVPAETRSVEAGVTQRELETHTVYVVAADKQMIPYINNPRYEFVALASESPTTTIDVLEDYVAAHGRKGVIEFVQGIAVFRQLSLDPKQD